MKITCFVLFLTIAVYFVCQLSRKGMCAVRTREEEQRAPHDEG